MSTAAGDPRLKPCQWDPTKRVDEVKRKLLILVPANIVLTVWYFGWLCQPGRVGNPVLFALLLVCEVFNLTHALGFWWTALHARAASDISSNLRIATSHRPTVDVLIPVYDEPTAVVEPTVVAASNLGGADVRVFLLDDKGRDELAVLAKSRGVNYVRRSVNTGAKAGNLNHALELTSSEFIAVFDCDHVPAQAFLDETLPLLAEPDVALVQTPQYYANHAAQRMAAAAWSQQALFFGIIVEGKAGLDSMLCCGTNVVFRRRALEEVGGFPEDSLTEDFLLSVRLHENGWHIRYLPRVLAQGLGPEDAGSYASQQRRWAKGCIGAIPAILRARLTWKQRIQYLLSASYFLSGWVILMYMSLPVIRILTGAQPLAGASAAQFLSHFLPYYALNVAIVAVAGAGTYTFAAFCVFISNYWVQIDATLATLFRRSGGFIVTPKQGSSRRQPGAVAPALNTAGLLAAVAVNGLIVSPTPGTLNNVAFAGFHVTLLLGGAWPALVRSRPATVGAAGAPSLRWLHPVPEDVARELPASESPESDEPDQVASEAVKR